MYDCIIIGSGPAGVSAALTLKARGKSFMIFGSNDLSAKARSAEKVQNYPGLPMVSGAELLEAFKRQLDGMDIEITEKQVTGVYPMGDHLSILCGQEMFDAKTIIITTGVASVKTIPGELEFVGRGVSYCATCDGFLYKDKTIAVECTSAHLEGEVRYLADIAAKVYLIPLYKDCTVEGDNIEIIKKAPREITGGMKAEKVVFSDSEIEVDGIFMLKDSFSPTVLLSSIEMDGGHIAVDRQCRTSVPGIFAAGDCTGRPYQYTKAVGEGNIAAHSVLEYLDEKKD